MIAYLYLRGVYRKQSSWLCNIFVGASFQRGAGPSGNLFDVFFAKACCLAGEKTEANQTKSLLEGARNEPEMEQKCPQRQLAVGIHKQVKVGSGVRGRFLIVKCHFGRP